MNCPNCGAETNESVCPVCGAAVGTSGGFKLAGNDQPQQPEGVTYDAQPQQGMGMDPQYGGPQYQGDPMQNGYAGNAYGTDYQQPTKKKKSGVGAVIGIIIALVVIAAAVKMSTLNSTFFHVFIVLPFCTIRSLFYCIFSLLGSAIVRLPLLPASHAPYFRSYASCFTSSSNSSPAE